MKISTKCRYGIRAVIEIARNYNDLPTKRNDIAAIQNIPTSYLENILIALKHNNVVVSIRGAGGGFMLKRPPTEISLLDVFEALQGDLALLDCLDFPETCDRSNKCLVRPVWVEMQEAQKAVLRKTTIAELLKQENPEFC
ncbi:MAG: Rrf2 family transcriptional regulator [Proteobacteria bacterium]|nr:Rrf2 family transcriptional regulator [Pseudomonadota bacterium]